MSILSACIKRKTSNVLYDIMKLILSIFYTMVLILIIVWPVYIITGYILIPVIMIAIINWYLNTSCNNSSFNPLKWLVKIFGFAAILDDEYYSDNYDKINEYLFKNHSYWQYAMEESLIPVVTIYNNEIHYNKNNIIIMFFTKEDAVQFKLIFNNN